MANALYPLVEAAEPFQEILGDFQSQFQLKYNKMLGAKIGLGDVTSADYRLLADLEQTLQLTETDMTIFFRLLSQIDKSSSDESHEDAFGLVADAFYQPTELTDNVKTKWRDWFRDYRARLNKTDQSDAERAAAMNAVNPKYVLRNYMAQLAIDKATAGDVALIEELHQLLKRPYDEQREDQKWFAKRPEWARNKVGCSMLSCSS